MKKIVSYSLIIVLIITMTACNKEESDISDESVDLETMPIELFGNHAQNWQKPDYFIGQKGYVYTSKENSIYKIHINEKGKEELIYADKSLNGVPQNIHSYKDWIYYFVDNEETGCLYRIKEDGSRNEKLLNSASTYVLTKDMIYYDTYRTDPANVCVMKQDGSKKRKLLSSDYNLVGLDNGWIYYNKYDSLNEEETLYRMTKDGANNENVFNVFNIKFDADNDMIHDLIIDKNFIAYVHNSDNFDKYELVMKNVGEKENAFEIDSSFECLNKEGDWLYYMIRDNVYKLNIKEKKEKTLVFDFNDSTGPKTASQSIQLNNGDALLTRDSGSVYVKSDGTTVELDKLNP